jgi:hypothetical protein
MERFMVEDVGGFLREGRSLSVGFCVRLPVFCGCLQVKVEEGECV